MKDKDIKNEILKVDNIYRFYKMKGGFLKKDRFVRALNGISFCVKKKTTTAIVGESGCGKSTLARIIAMLDTPSDGDVVINGAHIAYSSKKNLRRLRPQVQMVFQNPYASLNPRKTIIQTLAEPLLINTKLSWEECREKISNVLKIVGLDVDYAQRYPHMFSGGQRQRVAIARAMILDPLLIVADEPVSALDVSIQAQILNLFMDLQDRFSTSYVFISHNLSVVRHMAHDIIVMYLGLIVEQGDKDAIYAHALHPYTQALMSATPNIHTDMNDNATNTEKRIHLKGDLPSPLTIPSGCPFHTRCPYAKDLCATERPQLRSIDNPMHRVACHFAQDIALQSTT